ncbi:hypothetical protein GCM10027170_15370 [Aliiglaciecola aliphaticivorans]
MGLKIVILGHFVSFQTLVTSYQQSVYQSVKSRKESDTLAFNISPAHTGYNLLS